MPENHVPSADAGHVVLLPYGLRLQRTSFAGKTDDVAAHIVFAVGLALLFHADHVADLLAVQPFAASENGLPARLRCLRPALCRRPAAAGSRPAERSPCRCSPGSGSNWRPGCPAAPPCPHRLQSVFSSAPDSDSDLDLDSDLSIAISFSIPTFWRVSIVPYTLIIFSFTAK